MGSFLSGSAKNKKKAYTHDNCTCDLYQKYSHCCVNECFHIWDYDKKKKQLANSLKKYHADYFTDIILDYLPKYDLNLTEITTKDTSEDYESYIHSPLFEIYKSNKPPCSIWMNGGVATGNADEPAREIKVVVLGTPGVGKSALTIRFVADQFLEEYDPTIEDSYRKQIVVNKANVLFDVLDTAGREEFTSIRDQWIREGELILICFAINSQESFDDTSIYRERVLNAKGDDNKRGMILVGTKCDLRNDKLWNENNLKEKYPQKLIDRKTILDLANEWNVPYIETSAKLDKNIEFLFHQCLYEYWIQSQTLCAINK